MFINWFKKSKMEHNRCIFHAVEVYSLAEIERTEDISSVVSLHRQNPFTRFKVEFYR